MLRFNIAGLSIAINTNRNYALPDAYRDFYDSISEVSDNTDFSIDIFGSKKTSSDINGIEHLFDSGGPWRLYRDKDNCYIVVSDSRKLIIDRSISHAELYVKSPHSNRRYPFPFSYPLDEIFIINLLTAYSGILVHACGIDDNGHGLLFAGTSGTGKSTTARLWSDINGITILSDDRIILRKINGKLYACGTPWHGDAKVSSPEKVVLEKVLFLNHAQRNKMKRIKGIDAVSRLLVCSFPTFYDKKGMESTLRFIDEIVGKVPCYVLDFLPDKGVIDFVRGR